jgi:putative transposase
MLNRRTPRNPDWDYRTPGLYFLTMVTRGRSCLFGQVDDVGQMNLSWLGTAAKEEWSRSIKLFPDTQSHAFAVLPNHIHAIVSLYADRPDHCPGPSTLSAFVGSYKSAVARRAGRRIWQRSFYDRAIRDENELAELVWYVELNPERSALDAENPERAGTSPAPTERQP